ncbi:MAG: hypothetical protein QOE76_3401 [Frankiales bacterium]|nr:hypothetical protein [Frankiales bacterium]
MREALAALGPWFAVGQPEPDGDWQPLAALLTSDGPLADRVDAVRAALGGDRVPVRVAASVAQLGLVARLVAPAFGAALLDRRVPALDQAWWQPGVGGPMPLALSDGALAGAAHEDLAQAFTVRVLEGPVRDLVELTAAMSVSRRVLWGNVASALNGAVTMLGRARPDLAADAGGLAGTLLDRPVLRGTATGLVGVDFRRRSCCLLYRLAPAGARSLCGDCVIVQL